MVESVLLNTAWFVVYIVFQYKDLNNEEILMSFEA